MNSHQPPQWGPQPTTPQAPKPKTGRNIALGCGGTLVAGLLLLGGCTAIVNASSDDKPKAAPTVTPSPSGGDKSPDEALKDTQEHNAKGREKLQDDIDKAAGERTSWSDGTYLVGSDIKPGTYVSPGATPGLFELCTASTEGDGGHVNALDNGNKGEQVVITVTSADKMVEFSGCEPFVRR